jgi:hypothetical protein
MLPAIVIQLIAIASAELNLAPWMVQIAENLALQAIALIPQEKIDAFVKESALAILKWAIENIPEALMDLAEWAVAHAPKPDPNQDPKSDAPGGPSADPFTYTPLPDDERPKG